MVSKSREPCQLLYALKVGDGCYVKNSTGKKYGRIAYYVMSNSIHLDYVSHKKSILEKNGIYVRPIHTAKSGYKESSVIYTLETRCDEMLNLVGAMSIDEVLDKLTKEGLIYFYLDDGTYHQRKHFGHIYCNTFSESEVDHLIYILYKFYPYKRCAKRYDRKKDGRSYPYIYIPVSVMNAFKVDVEKFLIDSDLQSLMYKVGVKEVYRA